MAKLKAPFPYFGGKSQVADLVWSRLGDVPNYCEPFFGSGAVLLMRPKEHNIRIETINDLDGFVANFWRAIKANPEAVARHADWPVNENDLHARHIWLVSHANTMQERLEGNPNWYSAKIAGWWVWGMSAWIGHGFCSGKGPWRVRNGKLVKVKVNVGDGISKKRPNLSNAGKGINRQLPHLSNAGKGVNRQHGGLYEYMNILAERMRKVRVCCGDWKRICTNTPTTRLGLTAVFLDPPYSAKANRRGSLYRVDSASVANEVRKWAIEHGDNPKMRIAFCGYEGEHSMPDDWECVAWKAKGGYGSQGNRTAKENKHRERIWFSPACNKGK